MHLKTIEEQKNKNLHDLLIVLLILSLIIHIIVIPLMGKQRHTVLPQTY